MKTLFSNFENCTDSIEFPAEGRTLAEFAEELKVAAEQADCTVENFDVFEGDDCDDLPDYASFSAVNSAGDCVNPLITYGRDSHSAPIFTISFN